MRKMIVDSFRTLVGEGAYRRVWKWKQARKGGNRWLRDATGVIHVGANSGQERDLYDGFDLNVVWIEPIPQVFEELTARIAGFPRQRAYQCLVTDVDGREYEFNVANNNGQSSSILPLSEHTKVWPDVAYSHSMVLRSITLESLVRREGIDIRGYQGLILDTQGSELMVLKGAEDLLPAVSFVKTEVADFKAYEGCCLLTELNAFMREHGFHEEHRHTQLHVDGLGAYYDILYCRG
jgi:FkbM family methyltransferase